MNLLITGAKGQLGQDITARCRLRDIHCVAADSKTLDITDANKVGSLVADLCPDVIINCAAYNAVDLAETAWKKAFMVNGLGVKNLVLAANECGSILVHYSTDYVFDGQHDRPYTIADSPNPLNRYGESKLLGENIVRDLGKKYFLIRTSWVFGRGNSNFVLKLLEWSRGKTEISVVDDQVSSPTSSSDLARVTLDLLPSGSFGLYHSTNSGSCSRYEWAQYILEQVGWKGKLNRAKSQSFNSAALRPAYSVLDNFGTDEILGYTTPSWQEATTRYLEEIGAIP
jgi:dTDP-4-dehydrorhamnose reductase